MDPQLRGLRAHLLRLNHRRVPSDWAPFFCETFSKMMKDTTQITEAMTCGAQYSTIVSKFNLTSPVTNSHGDNTERWFLQFPNEPGHGALVCHRNAAPKPGNQTVFCLGWLVQNVWIFLFMVEHGIWRRLTFYICFGCFLCEHESGPGSVVVARWATGCHHQWRGPRNPGNLTAGQLAKVNCWQLVVSNQLRQFTTVWIISYNICIYANKINNIIGSYI